MTKPYNNLNPKALVVFGIILILFLLQTSGYAQTFYVCTDNLTLQKVTITPNGLQTQKVEGCGNGTFFSIALDVNKLYYNDLSSDLYVADLVTKGNSPTIVANCKYVSKAYGNALTVGAGGVYYVIGTELIVVNPRTGVSKSLGRMSQAPSGDLAFYNKELYMATTEGILKVPLDNPLEAVLWLPIANDQGIYGLTAVNVNNTTKVYAFLGDSDGGTNVLEIDLDKRKILSSIGTLPYRVYDAGSQLETSVEPPLQVKEVKITQDCDKLNRGTAEVITGLHTSEYVFALNTGVSNNTGLFTNLAPGNYNVTVKAAGQPDKLQNFTIPDYSLTAPGIAPVLVNPICDIKGSIQLKISTSGYRIKYNNVLYDTGYLFADLSAGTYHFTVVNAQGCVVDEKDYTLEQQVCPPINITSVSVSRDCEKPNSATAQVVTDAHVSVYTYTLNNGASNTTGLFVGLAPGNYNVTVKAGGQPEKARAFTIPDYSLTAPAVVPVLINPLCDMKGSIQIKISTGGYRIRYNNVLYENGYLFADLLAGSYHYTIVNEQGCVVYEKDYTLTQEVCPPINITAINIAADCEKFGLVLVNVITSAHPDKYTYTLAGVTNATGTFTNLLPGKYPLVIESYADKKEMLVEVPDFKIVNKPNLLPVIKNVLCNTPGSIKFIPNGDIKGFIKIKYNGTFYHIGQEISDLLAGTYHFAILSEQDCILDEVDLQITKEDCDPIDFPNTFTPNNDGLNDFFRPKLEGTPIKYSLMVFARSGQQMFQTNNTLLGWDGTFKGAAAPAGVYYWVCTYTKYNFNNVTKKGWVTLVR